MNDPMAMHLLFEMAVYDSTDYEILSHEEVDELKKELSFLKNRMDAAKRKLALESKVRDAALSLSRLYSKKGRQRRSLLGAAVDVTKHTDEELMVSNRKCEELAQELWRLNNRAVDIQQRLLQHSAGVLSIMHYRGVSAVASSTAPGSPSSNYTYADGTRITTLAMTEEFDDRSFYRTPRQLEEFEQCIGDGKDQKGEKAREIDFITERLEGLNNQVLELLPQAGAHHLSASPDDCIGIHDQFARLEEHIQYLRKHSIVEDDFTVSHIPEDICARLIELWDMILAAEEARRSQKKTIDIASDTDHVDSEDEDDIGSDFSVMAFTGKVHSLHDRYIKLLEERFTLRRQIVQQRRRFENEFGESKETQSAVIEQINSELTDVRLELTNAQRELAHLSSLLETREFEFAESTEKSRELVKQLSDAEIILQELRAQLNEKTQRMLSVTQQLEEGALEKEDTTLALEKQVQSEAEEILEAKVRQREDRIAELEFRLDEIKEDRDLSKAELGAVMAETDARLKDLELQIGAHREARSVSEQARAASDEATNVYRSSSEEKEKRIVQLEKEIQELSEKVAELSLEVAMSKAELDQVYGSKQQRSAEADAARAAAAALVAASQKPQTIDPGLLQEIEELSKKNLELIDEIVILKTEKAQSASNGHLEKRCKVLQTELDNMLADFEGLTKQSIEHEQERAKLEALADGLRERVEELETGLAEEKIGLLGVKAAGIVEVKSPGRREGESTTTSVLKQEFKKMMREQRAEQQRVLKVMNLWYPLHKTA